MDTDRSVQLANAAGDRLDRNAAVRCPGCKRTNVLIVVGQYSYCTQEYDAEGDDWAESDYGEGDIQIGARCSGCGRDLTRYLLGKGWTFSHDVEIPNRHHQRVPKRQNPDLWAALHVTNADLDTAIAVTTERLGRLLDERERRRP